MVVTLGTSVLLVQPVYRVAFGLQLSFHALNLLATARLKHGPRARLADAALTVVILNTAAMVAFANFISGCKEVVWVWVRRQFFGSRPISSCLSKAGVTSAHTISFANSRRSMKSRSFLTMIVS